MDSESAGHRHDGLDPLLLWLRKAAVDAELDGERQRMALRERETDRWLKIVLVAAAIVFSFLALLVAPWVVPATVATATFGYLRLRAA